MGYLTGPIFCHLDSQFFAGLTFGHPFIVSSRHDPIILVRPVVVIQL